MNSEDINMLPAVSFIDIPVAHNIQQLLAFDDQSFLYCAYRTLLGRDPDEVGIAYYIGRLQGGEKKIQILKELQNSAEGQRINNTVIGLRAAIHRHALISVFGINRVLKFKKKLASRNTFIDAIAPNISAPIAATAPQIKKNVRIIRLPEIEESSTQKIPLISTIKSQKTVWVDLTTSMEWTEGVVGIIRAELEIACGLHKLDQNVRFSMQIENGFVEIAKDQLLWLLHAENVADAYMNFFGRYKKDTADTNSKNNSFSNEIIVAVPNQVSLYFPYKPNDIIISAGWMDSRKEIFYSKVKEKCSGIQIGYLIYDIILLLEQTRHFYHPLGQEKFKNYVKWISYNADFIIYGGNTAKQDTEALQASEKWPTPLGAAVKFGSDILKSIDSESEVTALKELGVTGAFFITVGSIEPRKNHDTLYKAYLLAQQMNPSGLPQLIICGRPMWRVDDIVDTIDRDPRLSGKVIRVSPTDTQLSALYKHCSFTVLPSLYEGWSLTLPESLGQGKFCLCADTPPLREIGGDLIDYAPPWDVKTWAEKITLYSFNKEKLKYFEQRIASEWPDTRWSDTAKMIYNNALEFSETLQKKYSVQKVWDVSSASEKPTIWMDLTLSFLDWQGNVNGIIRSELNYARYLKQIAPETRFFAYTDDYFFEVEQSYLIWLFDDSDLSLAYSMFQNYWAKHESAGTGFRNPFRVTGGPVVGHSAYLKEFPDNSIVLFVGIDFIEGKDRSRTIDVVKMNCKNRGILTSQLIYDFTPMLYPQYHVKETCSGYTPFIKHVSENFGHLVYGGRTAQRDGIAVQKSFGWGSPLSDFVEFGSNFEKINTHHTEGRDAEILKSLGVEGKFVITVGTIEPRKNHEMLYKAYVTILEGSDIDQIPKMLFIGKKGWKSEDFVTTFEADERVKGKIIMMSPTDDELDVLYRHCLFTLLPSFYEGWSLTLPESLSYGKFCLTSDVDPLRETGRDLVEYINPLDTYAWADRIRYYSTHPVELVAKEAYIKQHWKAKTWLESAAMLTSALYAAHKSVYSPDISSVATPIKISHKSIV
jgi:glycosyltransferase involved in cell wall biosynthesis